MLEVDRKTALKKPSEEHTRNDSAGCYMVERAWGREQGHSSQAAVSELSRPSPSLRWALKGWRSWAEKGRAVIQAGGKALHVGLEAFSGTRAKPGGLGFLVGKKSRH